MGATTVRAHGQDVAVMSRFWHSCVPYFRADQSSILARTSAIHVRSALLEH